MKVLVILVSCIFLVQGTPIKTPVGTATDTLEGLPWIKASKAKARFGTTPSSQVEPNTEAPLEQSPPFALTNEILQDYIAALTANLQQYVIEESASPTVAEPSSQPPTTNVAPPLKRLLKPKVPKQVDPLDVPTTTESYWEAEKKMYPDSFYDEFYLDWLRKRQVEEYPAAVVTPYPTEFLEAANLEPTESQQQVQPATPPLPPPAQQYPSIPLTYNPYLMNPFMYPMAGIKVSKAMAQAQVNAALAAMNITTTPKPVKIKLKIPIPAGSDLAQVVSSGIAGFPTGTTYELSKKK